MRLLLIARRTAPVLALCLALAACHDKPAETSAPAADATAAAPAPAPTDASTTPPAEPAVDSALEGELIASTNEPFWQAQVSGPGPTLSLRGIDSQRELAVASSQTVGDTRTLHAVDASGTVDLKVTASACQDSMSGASFPYSAALVIDGGTPINGCARPASMPPPGEPQ